MIDDIVLNKGESIERCIQKKHGMTILFAVHVGNHLIAVE